MPDINQTTQQNKDDLQQMPVQTTSAPAPVSPVNQSDGIISSVASQPAPVQSPTDKPTQTQVDAPTETVESRLNSLTANDSKYIQLARSDASREANKRGMINSAMAAGAGEEAAIRSALPIAQQDAATYTQTRLANQEVTNKFEENTQVSGLTREEDTIRADLQMKMDTNASLLTQQEQEQLNNLNMARDASLSGLTMDEDRLRNELNMIADEAASQLTMQQQEQLNELNMKRDIALSGLTVDEQENLNNLQMKRDQGLSTLTIEENRELNELEMKRDAARSGLTQTENEQLNTLEMKRDQGLAALTAEENQQLSELENKRDVALSLQRIEEDKNRAELNDASDRLKSTLSQGDEEWSRELQTNMELTLANAKLSHDQKMAYISAIENITMQAADAILEMGLSDKTAAAQTAAILDIERKRDSSIAIYEDLLDQSTLWDWGTGEGAGGAPLINPNGDVLQNGGSTSNTGIINGSYSDNFSPTTFDRTALNITQLEAGSSRESIDLNNDYAARISDWKNSGSVAADKPEPHLNYGLDIDSFSEFAEDGKYNNNNLSVEANAYINLMLGNNEFSNGNFNDTPIFAEMGNFNENVKLYWDKEAGKYNNDKQSAEVNKLYNEILGSLNK